MKRKDLPNASKAKLGSSDSVSDAGGAGYARPPKHTRWLKGQSGNPAGRPKNSLSSKTFSDLLTRVLLDDTVTFKDKNGATHSIPKLQAILIEAANRALKGNSRDTKTMVELFERYADATPEESQECLDEDVAILRRHGLDAAVQDTDRSDTEESGSEPLPDGNGDDQ